MSLYQSLRISPMSPAAAISSWDVYGIASKPSFGSTCNNQRYGAYEPQSVAPLMTSIAVPYVIPYVFKASRLWLI